MTAADGTLLTVGSQGLIINIHSDEKFNIKKVALHFKDGTQYCLEDRDTMILDSSGALRRSSEEYFFDPLVILYNRLIDINEVLSVEVTGKLHQPVLDGENHEPVFHHKSYVFYP